MNTTLQDLLGIALPIIQAPMAGAQGSALAIAVSNAGGLGSLPCSLLSFEEMRTELARVKQGTDKPYNVNFFCHNHQPPDAAREAAWKRKLAPYYDEYGIETDCIPAVADRVPFNADAAALVEEFKPAVVSFHFGLPAPDLLSRVTKTGAMVLSSATTVEEAIWLVERGVDAVIAQGSEAGGHRGMFLSDDLSSQADAFSLLPQIQSAVEVPVILAGGIADARTVAAAIELGAAAVQIGTAYLLCPEATTSSVHRAALRSEVAHQSAISNVFTGRPARGIVNRMMRELGPMNDQVPAFPHAARMLSPLRQRAEAQGNGDFSPLWAGANTTGCQEIPAADLTKQLAALLV